MPPIAVSAQRSCTHASPNTAADAVCGSFERPLVALFIAGAARTFAQPLLYRTIRTNLLEAFGGDVTLLMHVKLNDKRGDQHPSANAKIEPSETAVRAAFAFVASAAARSQLELVRKSPHTACPSNHGFDESLLAQSATRMACWRMLQTAEGGQRTHTVVIYTRCDVAWPTAIAPHCFFDLNARARLWDWVWLLPRRDAENFFTAPFKRIAAECNRSAVSVNEEGPTGFFYQEFPARELFDSFPAVLARQDIPGVPERSNLGARNGYQKRWTWPATVCRQPPQQQQPMSEAPEARAVINDQITWRNPCANVATPLGAGAATRVRDP